MIWPDPQYYEDWKSFAEALIKELQREFGLQKGMQLPVSLASSMPSAAQMGQLRFAVGATGPAEVVVATSTGGWKNVGDGSLL